MDPEVGPDVGQAHDAVLGRVLDELIRAFAEQLREDTMLLGIIASIALGLGSFEVINDRSSFLREHLDPAFIDPVTFRRMSYRHGIDILVGDTARTDMRLAFIEMPG